MHPKQPNPVLQILPPNLHRPLLHHRPLRRNMNHIMVIKSFTIRGNILSRLLSITSNATKTSTMNLRGSLTHSQELRITCTIALLRVLRLTTRRLRVNRVTFSLNISTQDSINFTRSRRLLRIITHLRRRAPRNQIHSRVFKRSSQPRIRRGRLLRRFRVLIRQRLRLPRSHQRRLQTRRLITIRHPTSLKVMDLHRQLNSIIRRNNPTRPRVTTTTNSIIRRLRHVSGVILVNVRTPLLSTLRIIRLQRGRLRGPHRLRRFRTRQKCKQGSSLIRFHDSTFTQRSPSTIHVTTSNIRNLTFSHRPRLQHRTRNPRRTRQIIQRNGIKVTQHTSSTLFRIIRTIRQICRLTRQANIRQPHRNISHRITTTLIIFRHTHLSLQFTQVLHVKLATNTRRLSLSTLITRRNHTRNLRCQSLNIRFTTRHFNRHSATTRSRRIGINQKTTRRVITRMATCSRDPRTLLFNRAQSSPRCKVHRQRTTASQVFQSPSSAPSDPHPSNTNHH